MKVAFKYALRLSALLFTMTLVLLAFLPMLSGGDWQWVGYTLGTCLLIVFFMMAVAEGSDRGEKDIALCENAKRRENESGGAYKISEEEKMAFFVPSRGFIAGLLASVPMIIVGICMCVLRGDIYLGVTPIARLLLSPYLMFFEPLRAWSPGIERFSYLFFSLLFPLATGIGYAVMGPKRRKKLMETIKKADKKKKKSSKVNKKKPLKEDRSPIN